MQNRITTLFQIKFPIIQAGMLWTSGWKLASAASNTGCLGLIGSASMYPDVLRQHIRNAHKATNKPVGVNVALIYPQIDEIMNIIVEEKIKIVFTSAGNPKTWTGFLKDKGITVVHVVPGAKFARKAEEAGCDAVVAEGFEAGGHNGREETTTLVLIPLVSQSVKIPVIAAGGIATGKGMLAAMTLGAEGVQIGSRFAASSESSLHANFKKIITTTNEGDTVLALKKLVPVRLIRNAFYKKVEEAENRGANADELKELLGRARAKLGMFEGDLDEGELEIGQVAALIKEIKPVSEIVEEIIAEYNESLVTISGQTL